MSEILFYYQKVHPTTWAYLSSLLTIALFFKFSRFWSMRNLDLLLLVLLGPGLLIVQHGQEMQRPDDSVAAALRREGQLSFDGVPGHAPPASTPSGNDAENGAAPPPPAPLVNGAAQPEGAASAENSDLLAAVRSKQQRGRSFELFGFCWLFVVGGLLLTRLLFDPTMVRRPLLEPNLSVGGLTFLGCCLLVFLMANVLTGRVNEDDLQASREAERILSGERPDGEAPFTRHGPGLPLLYVLPNVTTMHLVDNRPQTPPSDRRNLAGEVAVKIVAVLGHLAVVLGIVMIGYWHFDNIKTGISVAALYLLLPYTSLKTGFAEHVIPAAFMIWAVVFYRRPLVSGVLMGLAMGVAYYPLYLLPLWLSFYWERGVVRFTTGVVCTLLAIVLLLVFTSTDWLNFWEQFTKMFGLWWPLNSGLMGVWGLGWDPVYRIPMLAAFVVLAGSLAVWPAQKNLGTLMSCSAAVMLASQFWHGFGGGLFMAWYLPLALLTIFRPNLEDRVALVVLGEGWFPRRREPLSAADNVP